MSAGECFREPETVQREMRQHGRLAGGPGVRADSSPRTPGHAELAARLRRLGIALTVAAVAVQSVLHAVNAVFLGADVEILDADAEATPATWASSVAVFAAALAAAMLAVAVPSRRRLFGVLAAVLAFLSLDDVAQFHERLNRFGETWTLYALPLLALTLVLLWRVAQTLSRPERRLVYLGLSLLVLAVAMETLQRAWLDGYEEGSWVRELDTGLEEAFELAGWGLVATALVVTVSVVYHRSEIETTWRLPTARDAPSR